jgi:chromosome segregation ATPase
LNKPVDHAFELPNGKWTLSVAPSAGWSDAFGLALKSALGLIFSLLLCFLTYSLLGTRAKALQIARELTSELRASKEALLFQTVALEEEMAERQMAQQNLQEKARLLEAEIEKHQEAQEELERLNEQLEQRVQERTAALEQMNAELNSMNQLFVGRELRMVELKERIQELENATN